MESTTTQIITVRVEPESYERITKLAEEERRPISNLTRILLDEALAARSKNKKKSA